MNKLKIALLGCGDVAQRDYLPEWHRIADRTELVAVCGRGEERARAVAERHGIGRWYTDYERMLAESDADAVVNLTPIQLHPETNIAALEAGKHLYTEKPVAPTLEGAQRILQEARRQELTVVSAPCVMLFPQLQLVRTMLQENSIGRVCSARGYGHGGVPPWSGYMSDPSQFFIQGGGPVRDMGVYPLHALTGLLGPVRRVSAMAGQLQHSFVVPDGPVRGKEVPIEVQDNWFILLDFGEERLASVAANNCVRDTRAPQLELHGLQGTIALDLLDVSAPIELLQAGNDWTQIDTPRTGRVSGPDHLLGIEHLIDCINDRRKPLLSLEHAVHVVEIIEKAAQSAAGNGTLAIESRF